MQEASFNGFLKTVLYMIAFYYIFKFLFRLFFPIVIKKVVKKAEEQFKQQYQNQTDDFNTTTQKPNSDKPKETKKVGDYIDYEEIE